MFSGMDLWEVTTVAAGPAPPALLADVLSEPSKAEAGVITQAKEIASDVTSLREGVPEIQPSLRPVNPVDVGLGLSL